MFGIGPAEMIVIAVVALVFIGPQRLPEMMRQLGRFVVQAKRATADFREVVDDTVKKAERELTLEEQRKTLKEALDVSSAQKKSDKMNSPVDAKEASPAADLQQAADQEAKPGVAQVEGSLSSNVRLDRPGASAVEWEKDHNLDLPPLNKTSPGEAPAVKEGSTHVPVG
ncbi:MAG: Sec-independent protein translocase protein TatB [Oligoflexus sp.]